MGLASCVVSPEASRERRGDGARHPVAANLGLREQGPGRRRFSGMSHSTTSPFRSALLIAPLAALVALTVTFGFAADTTMPAPAVDAISQANTRTVDGNLTAPRLDRARTDTVRGFWSAPPGSLFVHHVVDHCDFEIRSAEGGTQPAGNLRTECDVETTVLDRRTGEILVRQQILGLRFLGADGRPIENDPIQQSFVAAAAGPVFLRIGPVGQILGLGFASTLDGDQRNFLRGTLGLFAFEAPPADASSWTSQVADTTGEYDARYEVLAGSTTDEVSVRRTRLRYTRIGNDEVPQHELRGAAEARFALALGWLREARLDEGMTIALPMLDLHAITARRATVTLVEASTTSIDLDVAVLWAGVDAPASGGHETIGAHAQGNERRRWQQRLEGVSLDQLLAEVQRVLAAEPVDAEALDGAFQQLQWLIKLDDRQAAELAMQLTTRQLGEGPAGVVLGALGAAGTPAAQEALAAVRADGNVPASVRQAATVACLQLAEPTAALVEGLARDADGASDQRDTSMLVLGALAQRAPNPLADGRSPTEKLLALESDSAARGDTSTWLLAIGNAAPPATLQIVQRHIGSPDAAVRSAACVALRRVADAQALPILIERCTTDPDAMVRRDAVLELGRRRAPGARAALQHVAQNDANEELRNKARELLGAGA